MKNSDICNPVTQYVFYFKQTAIKKSISFILTFTLVMISDGICQNRLITFIDKPFTDILSMATQGNKAVLFMLGKKMRR